MNRLFLTAMIFTTLIFSAAYAGSFNIDNLVLKKPSEPITAKAKTLLNSTADKTVSIWVYFTDKGIFSQNDFNAKTAKIRLTPRALERRTRNGINEIGFADIPVKKDYINSIQSIGAAFKRSSRWLNAAAFEIDTDQIDKIAALPFVYKIDPVAHIVSPQPIESKSELPSPDYTTNEKVIVDYGSSYDEINAINAIPMHYAGFTGEGVLVGMFDSGFRKSHIAFDTINAEGRLIAEYDFINNDGNVQNEGDDVGSQHNHGTATWSTLGGYLPGTQVGPAFGASFILAKTEDIPTETIAEEYNWIAALEWADSIGVDIVSSSVSYTDWYTYEDKDGATAPITIAANSAASLGILICNSMGNAGPNPGTLNVPADGYDMLGVGAVDLTGTIASFSSRGPTYDNRIKPEVCALGVSVFAAGGSADDQYYSTGGTSFSTPLTAGAAAVLLSANPTLTAKQLRWALMETANRADQPDNDYGSGVIDLATAFNWGANFTASEILGDAPFTVGFTDSSVSSASNWRWDFGDGDTSTEQNPSHTYDIEGVYDVKLIIDSEFGELTRIKSGLITVGPWQGARGDANNDGAINIIDITFLISHLYGNGPAPIVLKAGDANSDGNTNILDITFLINYLYADGPAPEE